MKQARIFQQYIWIVTLLMRYKRLTLEEISQRWINDTIVGDKPLTRVTFYRHKEAILNMFGIIIECDTDNGYKYYIANPEVLNDDSIERWMISTMTVNAFLSDSASLKNRILLENVPGGEDFLQTLILAMRSNRRINIVYQRFGADSKERTVSPYAIKLFHRRWYLLAYTGKYIATFSLDRILSMELTDETFEMPFDFSPDQYFYDFFGVTTDETPMAHVVIRASDWLPDYLRTLPLHHSQREISHNEEYIDFALDIRPTPDFIGELISYGESLKVLEPEDLRIKIRKILKDSLKNY